MIKFFNVTFNFQFSDSWVEEAKDKYCKNYSKPLVTNVSNQTECQARCEADSNCVGISYSHMEEKKNFCFICNDAILSNATNNFGFYRKKGTLLIEYTFEPEFQEYLLKIIRNYVITFTDACKPNPCHFGGICLKDGSDGYTCNCSKTGYTGRLCNIGKLTVDIIVYLY